MNKTLKKAYGYTRVSTLIQADEGISLENQKKKINGWCDLNDYELVKIYSDEGISGRSINKRVALAELLEIIKRGETLIVYSFSRLSRSVKDFLYITTNLREKECEIVILKEGLDTSTAHGKFVATLMAALAQLESDITSERVSDAMQHKITQGEFVGRPPYGWKLENGKGSNLIEILIEQNIIIHIKELRDKELSYQKIADILNSECVTPPGKSKKWYHSSVSRICNRGEVVVKGKNERLGKNEELNKNNEKLNSNN